MGPYEDGLAAPAPRRSAFLAALALLLAAAVADAAPAGEIGWPRRVEDGGATITIYQPQLDGWTGNQLAGRAAVSVATQASPTPTFGVVWFTARTDVDKATRTVTLEDVQIARGSFPTRSGSTDEYLAALRAGMPAGTRTISLDRLEASLAVTRAEQGRGGAVAVKNAPPQILFSDRPAILVLVDGEPVLRQVPGSSLLRVINTRALILFDQASGTYFLYVMNRWATASAITGPWSAATDAPAELDAAKDAIAKASHVDLLSDPPAAAKAELEKGELPVLYVATGPAELLQTEGAPNFQPIGATELLSVTNTASDIFLYPSTQTYYVLISGRWFRSPSLADGPWTFVTSDALPADFAKIPWQHPKGTVLASVADTPQAKEATISSTVPQTATVTRATAQMPPPQYDGAPKFEPIEGTSLRYAANTATPVIEVSPSSYYAVVNGVWFTAGAPTGPWLVADAVPPAIYAIPPSSPLYYVTYVYAYGGTPEVVYVGYTPGYYGTYVVPAGTVVYGTGYAYAPWVGSVWIGPPYTYGFGAGFAWGAATGFALGVAAGAYCHPWWGPAGWGWGWGTWGHGDVNVNVTHVNSVNVYDRWGKNTVAWGGDRYAGHVGNTTFAGNKGGDVYADRNGNVYRRNDGSWQKYDDGGWNDVNAKSALQDGKTDLQNRASGGGQGSLQGHATSGQENLQDRAAASGKSFSSLDQDFQARQAGNARADSWSQARADGSGLFGGDRAGGGDRFGGDRAGGGDRFGGGDFGGGFRSGGLGGFRGGFRR